MSTNSNIQTRPASISDKEFIISLLPRLEEFGLPPWRDVTQLLATDIQVLSDKLMNKPPRTAIFIAEDDQGVALGFIHLQSGKDYYYHDAHGHIADLIEGAAPIIQDDEIDDAMWNLLDSTFQSKYQVNKGSQHIYLKPKRVLAWDGEELTTMTR